MSYWIAHDHPERPLTYGAWLCPCGPCRMALTAATRANPTLALVAKTGQGRALITAAAWLDGADRHPASTRPGELFVADPAFARDGE